MKITSILPANGIAGGIRSTVNLSNCLLERGHKVRILYKRKKTVRSLYRELKKRLVISDCKDWLNNFKGKVEAYNDISKCDFDKGEVIIAVGSMTIEELYRYSNEDIYKLLYCHGLTITDKGLMDVWKLFMPSIAVSSTYVPKLQELSESPVLGVVHNGIHLNEYYIEENTRNGIGTIYSQHPIKSPGDIIEIVKCLNKVYFKVPIHLFGSHKKPSELGNSVTYTRLPSVAKAREIYNKCKIWLLMSKSEGLPGPVLEAMACGAVVISTDNLGSREIIEDGKNGFLLPVGNIDGFMEKIDFLVNNESERQKVVKNGFETVKEFYWERAADSMEEVLNKLVSGNYER